jgi:hypothetical protein
MRAAEFLARSRAAGRPRGLAPAGGKFLPLAYSPSEYYYLQAEVPAELAAKELGWSALLQEMLEAAGVASGAGADGNKGGDQGGGKRASSGDAAAARAALPGRLRLAQAPRVWASPAGAVSPLHFDRSASFLLQLSGRKRMLFLDPDQLPCAYPYPETHLLRRRSRVNPAVPDLNR